MDKYPNLVPLLWSDFLLRCVYQINPELAGSWPKRTSISNLMSVKAGKNSSTWSSAMWSFTTDSGPAMPLGMIHRITITAATNGENWRKKTSFPGELWQRSRSSSEAEEWRTKETSNWKGCIHRVHFRKWKNTENASCVYKRKSYITKNIFCVHQTWQVQLAFEMS